ncbi:MAG: class I SAM-dependent methyltransferase [Phycisphaerae bacterium]|nr:class I SAM-dependent methyltransferase [Phycisphaerae bacterium]
MSNASKAADKWNDAHRRRAEDGRFVHVMEHPTVRQWVRAHYTDGKAPIALARKHLPTLPVDRALELACGRGAAALRFKRQGYFKRLDAYDISGEGVRIARANAQREGLDGLSFEVADVNRIELPKSRYQFIYIISALHHIEDLEHVYRQINEALTGDGIFYTHDYVGPSRMQWTDEQIALANRVLRELPERYRRILGRDGETRDRLRRFPIKAFLDKDPSEGVRSAEIVPLARRYLDVVHLGYEGISYLRPMLRGIIHNFDPDCEADNTILRSLLLMEEALLEKGVVQPNTATIIARKKRRRPRRIASLLRRR